jgi:hypothetical protein
MRSLGAVLAGSAVWTVLWLGGTQGLVAAFPQHLQEGQPIVHVGLLLTLIALSCALSVLAGWITAAVAARSPVGHAGALAALQLALGIGFQASAWPLFPLWYHVTFLGLVVPTTVLGGVLRARSRAAASGQPSPA